MTTIAFIGLGNMGNPMAANLVKAGHKVIGFDLVPENLALAKEHGLTIAEDGQSAVKEADVVITMLPAGRHVLSVYGEIAPWAPKGALFIDSSTIDVESARKAHAIARENGLLSIDAPVSGGTGGAAAGTLTFMLAVRRRLSTAPSRSCSRWLVVSSIAARTARARLPRSATT